MMQTNSITREEAEAVKEFWANTPWEREPAEIRKLGPVGAYRYYVQLGTETVLEARAQQIAQESGMTQQEIVERRQIAKDELLDAIQGDLPTKVHTRGRPRG